MDDRSYLTAEADEATATQPALFAEDCRVIEARVRTQQAEAARRADIALAEGADAFGFPSAAACIPLPSEGPSGATITF